MSELLLIDVAIAPARTTRIIRSAPVPARARPNSQPFRGRFSARVSHSRPFEEISS
jgi:hypothetical protein